MDFRSLVDNTFYQNIALLACHKGFNLIVKVNKNLILELTLILDLNTMFKSDSSITCWVFKCRVHLYSGPVFEWLDMSI